MGMQVRKWRDKGIEAHEQFYAIIFGIHALIAVPPMADTVTDAKTPTD